jgi:hypothetical protein
VFFVLEARYPAFDMLLSCSLTNMAWRAISTATWRIGSGFSNLGRGGQASMTSASSSAWFRFNLSILCHLGEEGSRALWRMRLEERAAFQAVGVWVPAGVSADCHSFALERLSALRHVQQVDITHARLLRLFLRASGELWLICSVEIHQFPASVWPKKTKATLKCRGTCCKVSSTVVWQ